MLRWAPARFGIRFSWNGGIGSDWFLECAVARSGWRNRDRRGEFESGKTELSFTRMLQLEWMRMRSITCCPCSALQAAERNVLVMRCLWGSIYAAKSNLVSGFDLVIDSYTDSLIKESAFVLRHGVMSLMKFCNAGDVESATSRLKCGKLALRWKSWWSGLLVDFQVRFALVVACQISTVLCYQSLCKTYI